MPSSLPYGKLAISGIPLSNLTMQWDMGLVLVGAGAISGFRVAWSTLLGALINYLILAPWMIRQGVIVASHPQTGIAFRDITRWSLWIGGSIMVVSSLVSLAFQWKTMVRALAGIGDIFGRNRKKGDEDLLAAIEVPGSWVLTLFAVGGIGVITMLALIWHIPVWMGVIAVLLTFVLTIVACRATGETDTTPTGALGKITQLTYGVLKPADMTSNIMTASVTANAAGCAADLLTDLKSGYLLGANARKQFIAQLAGILPGAIIVGLAWNVLVPNADALGGDRFPAPAAQVWKSVAELLSKGVDSLPVTARYGALIGAFVGLVLTLLERTFPKKKKYIPSAIAFGLAFVMQGFNAVSMMVGASIALIIEKTRPKVADDYVIPVASGLIAGESLMAIVISLMFAMGVASK